MKQSIAFILFILLTTNTTMITSAHSTNTNSTDITQAFLEQHLSRAISMQDLTNELFCYAGVSRKIDTKKYPCGRWYNEERFNKNMDMLGNIDARFIGRVAGLWGRADWTQHGYFEAAAEVANRINETYEKAGLERPIIQASIFEKIEPSVNKVPIPGYVAKTYGQKVGYFKYEKMRYDKKHRHNFLQGGTTAVADISKIETRMWFYYQATKYIDAGYEAIHFGQIQIMDDNDPGHEHWWRLLEKIRRYAKGKNRGFVICDAHTHGLFYLPSMAAEAKKNYKFDPKKDWNDDEKRKVKYTHKQLLFDFHSYPMRIKPTKARKDETGGEGTLEKNYLTAIYGKSKGGITPSGWETESLPFLVELDDYGITWPFNPESSYFVWGWDEISWYAKQKRAYQKEWLQYAYNRVRTLDPNGYFQMPGKRVVTDVNKEKNKKIYSTFRATSGQNPNNRIETTIKKVWDTASSEDYFLYELDCVNNNIRIKLNMPYEHPSPVWKLARASNPSVIIRKSEGSQEASFENISPNKEYIITYSSWLPRIKVQKTISIPSKKEVCD